MLDSIVLSVDLFELYWFIREFVFLLIMFNVLLANLKIVFGLIVTVISGAIKVIVPVVVC